MSEEEYYKVANLDIFISFIVEVYALEDKEKLKMALKLIDTPEKREKYSSIINYFNDISEKIGNNNYILERYQDCKKENIEVWKALIYLYENKLVRSIGVSNFSVDDIKNLIEATSIKPMVNQIRYFIGNRQDAITNYCQENDILIEAYSPLATGSLIDNEILTNMANKYNVSVAKLCIAYCLANNTLPLPKSKTKERIIANLDVDVNINKEDLAYLNSLGHIGPTKPYRS